MPAPLRATRYLLVIVPAVSGLFLSDIRSYSLYTLYALALVWLVQIGDKLRGRPVRAIALGGEIGLAFWICWTYGGIAHAMLFSPLLAVVEARSRFAAFAPAAVLLAAVNVSASSATPSVRLALNLALVAWAAALYALRAASSGMIRAESYNDALRRKHYELEEARNRLADYAAKVEHLAQVEERNRIARDIHDELGHKLVRLKMMMDAACAVIPGQPDKGFELVRQVRDQLTDSMDILRSTVRNMKPREAEHPYSLAALIEDLGKQNGIRLDFATEGMPYPLYPSEEIVLYRNAQEAVTNAIRHGGADAFRIRISYGERQVVMTVSNNGAVPESIARRGLGLSGMEERVALLGGSLAFELGPEFAVTTAIPRHRKPDER
ncbi:sensor histidine kinase [Paenibacillus flagellatus]|uniref:sensor histidine kinase n=1 Tax=Paenibacillus flagellatus TaxID=2211139 RepID=UPI0013051938|nr:sensor histidine kinase [Paenibacillus flagellatus]